MSEKHKQECRSHYQRNKQYYRDRNTRKAKAQRAHVDFLKSQPCMDCHKKYPPWVMDFDHRGDKSFTVGVQILRGGILKLLAEIKKCDLVCSNCHRERTHKRGLIA